MDLIWIAIAVDMALYAGIAAAVVLLCRRRLPPPWNRLSFTVPVVIFFGAVVTLSTFTNWLIFPR